MFRAASSRVYARFPFAVVFSLLIASCSGDGCSCVEPIPGGFPDDQRTSNAIQVRVSDRGIAAVEADPAGLLGGLIGTGGAPGVIDFEVPSSCGGDPTVCCPGGNPSPVCGPVQIDLNKQGNEADRLEINPVQGQNRIDVIVRARVKTAMDLPVGTFGLNCLVELDTTASGNESLTLTAQVGLAQDAGAGTTRVEVGSVVVTNFDDGDISIKPGDFLCALGGLAIGLVKDQFVGALEDAVKDAIEGQLCKACPSGNVSECGPHADACDSNTCMTGGVCLQELGIAGRLRGPAVLGSFSPGTQGAMDIYDVAGGYATTNQNGIALGLLGGALPAALDRERCGPPATAPAAVTVPQSNFFQGNTRPDTNAPFDWAVGVHEHNLDQIAYAAYDGGLLCLNVGTRTVDLLTSETLAVLFPSFIDLLHGEVGQVVLGLRPQSPPTIELGLGTFTTGGDIDVPLLDVNFNDLEIDFYGQVDDQYIRLMTLIADVHLPLNLDVDPNGEIVPVLGDVDDAFTEIRVTNSEALAESPAELESKVPAVLSLALPFLADGLGSFALPELGGLKLEVSEITAVDNEAFLAIFGNLVVNQAAPARVGTEARLVEVVYPDDDTFRGEAFRREARPAIELELGGTDPLGSNDLEWSVRIDEGLWSPYTQRRNVTLSRDSLWLQGKHRVEVRARVVGHPRTADLTPVVLEPVIDARPPTVRFAQTSPDAITVLASDSVSRRKLSIEYRLAGGSWHSAQGVPAHIDLDGHEANDLEVRVTDQAGNHTTTGPAVIGFHGTASGDSGCSCAAGGDSRQRGGALLLFALVLLGMTRRWRRTVMRAASVLLLAALPACSCGGSDTAVCAGPNGECAEGEPTRGPTGRWSSIAVSAERSVVSAYDEGLGDLVLIDVTAEPFTYTAVDGVPLELPVFEPDTYRGGVAGPGANVGAWTSVQLVSGFARISYQDLDNGVLRFASESESGWTSHEVDTDTQGGVVGLYTSLAYDPAGIPAIAYMAYGIRDGAGGRKAQLRYARASGVAPASSANWTVSVVDEVAISCAGLCDAGDVCAPSGAGEACVAPTSDCTAECGDAEACLNGTCAAIVPDPIAKDVPAGTGLFANLGFLPDGRAAIVYYDKEATDLVMQVDETAWLRVDLDATAGGDTGMFADMAIDGAGTVHVAYQDALGDQLLYTSWAGGTQTPIEVVDDGTRGGDRPHPVGAGAAIFADGSGVGIAYQDGATADLLLATRGQPWVRTDLLAAPHMDGFFTTAMAAGGLKRVASYRYDRAFFPPGELVVTTIP